MNSKSSKFIIYNINNKSVYNYISNKTNIVITGEAKTDTKELQFPAKNLWLKRNTSAPDIINAHKITEQNFKNLWITKNFFFVHGKKFCRIANKQYQKFSAPKKLKLDYLIISENANVKISSLRNLFEFKKIIIDSSNSFYKRKRLIKKLKKRNIPYHSVVEDGAFHLRFS